MSAPNKSLRRSLSPTGRKLTMTTRRSMKKHNTIKLEYDPETDAAYLTLQRSKVVESQEVAPGLIVDIGPDDQIVDVEILRFTRRFARKSRKPAS